MRIVVVDEVRLALRNRLKAFRDVEVLGEAASGVLAEALLTATWPDLVVLDVSAAGQRGVLAARMIRERFPGVRVVAFGDAGDRHLLEQAIRVGATGALLRDGEPEEIHRALRLAMEGRRVDLDAVAGRARSAG